MLQSTNNEIKDDFTRYSRPAPNIGGDDLKDKGEESLVEQPKLRDYASQFWDKKKQVK